MELTTRYLGLTLRNPVVASASPVTQDIAGIRRLNAAGVGAIVLPSLFEEQVRRQEATGEIPGHADGGAFAEARSYFPEGPSVRLGGVEAHLRLVSDAVAASDVPVIASLNGSTPGGWTGIARRLQDAGAAALELNVYAVPGGTYTSGAEVDLRHVDIVAAVCDAVTIPVSVKLSPFFSATGALARSLVAVGASGLVLFNRFLQPRIDTERIAVVPEVVWSQPSEARLAQTWIAILRGQMQASLAGTTGVEAPDDVAAYLLAGADVVMTASALLRHGPEHVAVLVEGLREWLQRKGFASADAARGILAVRDRDVEGYERTGYVSALRHARETYGPLT